MVLLISNYVADRQQSMQRFASMMLHGLAAAGVPAELLQPKPFFGRFRFAGNFVAKWLGYVDKFMVFPLALRRRLAQRPAVVHICDHSNSMYGAHADGVPVIVTCHDLLAVRGGLGEETDCPPSLAGKFLQRWILRGLRGADMIACVSTATLHDAQRLIGERENAPTLAMIPMALNYPYRSLSVEAANARLAPLARFDRARPFLLHVGSNALRKNRAGVLKIFAQCVGDWNAQMVFAGEGLSPELRALAARLGVSEQVVEISDPPSELLEALYSRATALLFPSRFEGFGWPIIEAQACGCPVICSNTGPMPEVAGNGAILIEPAELGQFARAALSLRDENEHAHWAALGLENARRFDPGEMIERYRAAYHHLAPLS